MGKRSSFDRIEKDFYRTIDPRAVEALNPHLRAGTRFAEPCVGAGDLMDALIEKGHECYWHSDIADEESPICALSLKSWHLHGADVIITNPPWSRPILHDLIMHLSGLKPAWLLFDADWAHTKQSAPYMPMCAKIVSVGRLLWIPGTKMTGKDNCAWYLFDAAHVGPTEFVGRS